VCVCGCVCTCWCLVDQIVVCFVCIYRLVVYVPLIDQYLNM